MQGMTRFLGDTPLRVAIRLLVLSFVVGLVLSALGIRPYQIYGWVERAVLHIYDMGFAFFANSFDYLIAGALIVVPIFIISRLLKIGGRRRAGVSEARPSAPVRPFDVTHRGVFRLAVPMTLAYISSPLVGIVDTAVIGRLGDAALLGGIAVGALVFDFVFATFNFLRSGTTGPDAQAFGAATGARSTAILARALIVAVADGVLIVLLQWPLLEVGVRAHGSGARRRRRDARLS